MATLWHLPLRSDGFGMEFSDCEEILTFRNDRQRAVLYLVPLVAIGVIGVLLVRAPNGLAIGGLTWPRSVSVAIGIYAIVIAVITILGLVRHVLTGAVWYRAGPEGVLITPPVGRVRSLELSQIKDVAPVDLPRGVRLQVAGSRDIFVPRVLLDLPRGMTDEDLARQLAVGHRRLADGER